MRNPMKDPATGRDLKPCPFCGGAAAAVPIYHKKAVSKTPPWSATVICMGKCMASMSNPGGMMPSKELALEGAIELWNRRENLT